MGAAPVFQRLLAGVPAFPPGSVVLVPLTFALSPADLLVPGEGAEAVLLSPPLTWLVVDWDFLSDFMAGLQSWCGRQDATTQALYETSALGHVGRSKEIL
jgi:hypothetical protein